MFFPAMASINCFHLSFVEKNKYVSLLGGAEKTLKTPAAMI